MVRIFKSTVMTAAEQVSQPRDWFLFRIFKINLQIVVGSRRVVERCWHVMSFV